MKLKKLVLPIALAAVVAIGLVGCGTQNNGSLYVFQVKLDVIWVVHFVQVGLQRKKEI